MVLSSLGKQSYFYIQTIWLLSCYKNAIKYQDLQFNISDFNKKTYIFFNRKVPYHQQVHDKQPTLFTTLKFYSRYYLHNKKHIKYN